MRRCKCLTNPRKKKSRGVKSVERGDHLVDPSQPIQRVVRYALTHKVQRGGKPSCWKTIILVGCRFFNLGATVNSITCPKKQIYQPLIPRSQRKRVQWSHCAWDRTERSVLGFFFRVWLLCLFTLPVKWKMSAQKNKSCSDNFHYLLYVYDLAFA